MRRILSVWFPYFALERHMRAQQHALRVQTGSEAAAQNKVAKPFVLVCHGVNGTRITAINHAAQQAGAYVGQPLTDARAACPLVIVDYANEKADADMLERLALWSGRYSPIVALDKTAVSTGFSADFGLFLDIAGCAHLFGGEKGLMSDLVRRLKTIGFTAQLALAPTPAAAHALSRYGGGFDIACDDEAVKSLSRRLPTEALRLNTDRTVLLRRLGLKTVACVARVPRHALERRFKAKEDAKSVQFRVDQFTGAVHEPLTPLRPPAPWRTFMPCPEPALDSAAVRYALDDLFPRLSSRMENAGQGARAWRLIAFHADGGSSAVSVRLSRASRDRVHVMRLFEEKLAQIDPGYGIDGFLLEAMDCDAVTGEQTTLIKGQTAANEALAAEMSGLIDRLSNRFGETNITYAQPVKSHIPERAWQMVQAVAPKKDTTTWEEVEAETLFRAAPRPFRLFDHPERAEVTAQVPDGPPLNFRWRRVPRVIIRARGPERIAPEWWRKGARGVAIRDYYEVEDAEGRRYWLFREGHYGGTTMPDWFVHGIFG